MKKIMIVDDETLVRIGIKSLIVWEDYGYTVVADAQNGEEAWEKIRECRPNIVLTDLKMSPGDGFELMEKCRTAYPDIRFIVLSNYNDFENVRQAMKQGASDYIFKLTVKADELLKILEEVSGKLPDREEKNSSEQHSSENRTAIKNSLIRQALSGEPVLLSNIQERLNRLSLETDFSKTYFVISVRIDNYRVIRRRGDFLETDLLVFAMINMMEEIFKQDLKAEVFHESDSRFLILATDQTGARDAVEKAFSILIQSVKQYYGLEISGAVSRTGRGFGWLKTGWDQNNLTLEQRFYSESGKISWYREKEWKKMHLPDQLRTVVFGNLLERMEFLLIESYLKELLDHMERMEYAPGEVRKKFSRLHSLMVIYLERHEIRSAEICDSRGVELDTTVEEYDFFEDLKRSELEMIRAYAQVFQSKEPESGKYGQQLKQVKAYAEMNLEKELSVAQAASMLNMSESHFSHIFKSEEGVSYMEYINACRMQKATVLLENTDLMISEIAEKVGIENPNYFSAQYKKRTGKSPSEFRRMLENRK